MTVLRSFLLVVALGLGLYLAVVHGIRGLAVFAALLVVSALPKTRAWRFTEWLLVGVTGSRRRAAVLVMSLAIAALLAVNVVEFIHH
jgi:hypothetical protein